MATGGKQSIPDSVYIKYKIPKYKVIASDWFL
jgi:hypothetical protein